MLSCCVRILVLHLVCSIGGRAPGARTRSIDMEHVRASMCASLWRIFLCPLSLTTSCPLARLRGRGEEEALFAARRMPHAACPMPHAPCPMPHGSLLGSQIAMTTRFCSRSIQLAQPKHTTKPHMCACTRCPICICMPRRRMHALRVGPCAYTHAQVREQARVCLCAGKPGV